MSKKKIYSKHLEKGRFYHRSDSRGGHPALIYKKSDRKNKYKTLIFTSSHAEGTTKLKRSIDTANPKKKYYVHLKIYIGKRRDFGRKVLTRLRVQKEDKMLLRIIIRKSK